MNTRDLMALMHGEIDGVNSAAESQRLRDHLQSDPEARRRYGELCETVSALEGIEMSEPSPQLRQAILSAVNEFESIAPRRTGAVGGLFHRWGAVIASRPAAMFATGLILGAGIFAILSPRLGDVGDRATHNLYGSALPGTSSAVPAAQTFVLEGPGAAGRVRAWFADDRITVSIDLTTDAAVQVVLATDPGTWCDSFRVLQSGNHDLVTGTGTTRLTHSGRGLYVIDLHRRAGVPSVVLVSASREGTLLGEAALMPQ